jgi:hypothetical protein
MQSHFEMLGRPSPHRSGELRARSVARAAQSVSGNVLVLCLIAIAAGPLWAAPPGKRTTATTSQAGRGSATAPVAANNRASLAVDLVEVTDAPPWRGLILHRTARGDLVLVVEREWLRTAEPDRLRKLTELERRSQPVVYQELLDRLRVWRAEPALPARLQLFLDAELARGETRLARWAAGWPDEDGPPFVWVDLPAAQIRRVRGATAPHRQIALVAWRENLAGVCTRPALELAGELQQLGIQPESERVNLADQLPSRLQTDREWQARRAILGYTQQEPLDFQGTATHLIQTGPDAPAANAAQLLAEALQSQLSQTLADLLNPDAGGAAARPVSFAEAALAKCRRQAQQRQLRGFRATAVKLDAAAGQCRVESRFEVQLGPQEWGIAWQASHQGGNARATAEARQRLREDPQVRRVLELLGQAGLAGDDAVEQALDVGLATQQMQQDLDAEFRLFLGHYGQHAEGPPLFLPEPAPR